MIEKKDVAHIANLARIALTDKEKEKLEEELSSILSFIEKLNEADTTQVAPAAGGTLLKNIMRRDEQMEKSLEGKSAELTDAASERQENWVKVKAVF